MKNGLPLLIIADDVELNRAILSEALGDQYNILEASDGLETLELLDENLENVSAVLLDIVMPGMDGFEVLEVMNQRGWIKFIPVIMISSENSEEFVLRSYSLGVSDFIGRPFSPSIVLRRVNNIVDLYERRHQLESMVYTQMRKLSLTSHFTVDALGSVIEFRNGESGQHIRQIRNITEALLRALTYRHKSFALTAADIEEISNAAALHDIGKIAIPENILNKPGRLTPEEFEVIKTHTVIGSDILKNIEYFKDQTYFQYCYDICRYHHERWDGRGYPDGLKGDQIPIYAQIVSVADVYDALTSVRVYKPAYSHEASMQMIENGECGVFNPIVLQCLKDIEPDLADGSIFSAPPSPEVYASDLSCHGENRSLSERILSLLDLEREKYQTLAALSDEILFDYDPSSDILTFSEKFRDVFDGDIIIRNYRHLLETSSLDNNFALLELIGLRNLLSPQSPVLKKKLLLPTKNGAEEWFEVVVKSLWSSDIIPRYMASLGKITNINAQMQERNRLRLKANQDPLTFLLNRSAAETRVDRLIDQNPTMQGALMFIDVDNFKTINDSYGHIVGDAVLKRASCRMQEFFRSTDVLGRIGGDEFVVFLNEAYGQEAISRKAGHLCNILKEERYADAGFLPLTISVGIALYPEDGLTYSELLNHADHALYDSKHRGKGTYSFFSGEGSASNAVNEISEIDSNALIQAKKELEL